MNAKSKKVYDDYAQYIQIRGFAKNTVKLYLKEAKDFTEYIYDVEYINIQIVLAYLSRYKKQSKATKNFHAVCMQSFIRYLEKNVYLGMKKIKLPSIKIGRKLPEILEQKAFMEKLNTVKVMADTSADWKDKRNYALIILMYATGMRVSEALKFQMLDITDSNWVRIDNAKGSKDRYVPIADSAVDALKEYIEACPYPLGNPFFISYKKTVLSRVSSFKILKTLMDLGPHSMRHHYATHMIINGSDESVVSELLGHASLITTQIYTHVQKPQLLKTMNECHPMAREENYAG